VDNSVPDGAGGNDELQDVPRFFSGCTPAPGTTRPPWAEAVVLVEACFQAHMGNRPGLLSQRLAALMEPVRTGRDAAKQQAKLWQEIRRVIQERTTTASAECRHSWRPSGRGY
jgi:hypothetical protein